MLTGLTEHWKISTSKTLVEKEKPQRVKMTRE